MSAAWSADIPHPTRTYLQLAIPNISLQDNQDTQKQYLIFQMEPKVQPSFLEISINTQKFSQFTNTLNTILSNHEKIIQQHTRELSQIRLTIDDKVNRVRSECEYEFEKIGKKLKEQSQSNLSFHSDLTRKYEFIVSEDRNRFNQFQQVLSQVGTKINKQEQATKEKIVKEIQKEVGQLVLNTKAFIEKEIQNVGKKIKQMESVTALQDNLVKNLLNAYQNRGGGQCDRPIPIQNKHLTTQVRYATPDKVLSLDQLTVKEGKERKRRKIQQKCQQQNLQYASISAKLQTLENRLTAKQNQSLNKVVYASKKPSVCFPSQASQHSLNISLGKIEIERRNLEQKISFKLQSIENILNENFGRLQREISKIQINQNFVREEVDLACRKMQKQKTRITQISLQVKRLQQRRVDEKLIENMVTMFKRQHRALQDELQKKMSAQAFNQERQRLGERIQVIGESVSQKADKEEIKRAFQFVQDKIKQIVMIIADDIHQQKEGAGKRIPFKCLSCDKSLQSSLPTTLRHISDKKASRPPTSLIRKKARIGHGEQKAVDNNRY